MKFSKKLLSLLLCAVMVLGSVAIGGGGFTEVLDAFSVKASAASYSDGTGSNDGWADSTHIRFGSYPQTDVTSSMGKTLDAKATGWKSYKYYSGTGYWDDGQMSSADYMMYCDVTVMNGPVPEKYRGVKFSTYRPSLTGDRSTTSVRTYQDDNGYTYGKTYWFKYEPLVWRVLDSSTGLVMCESIIDSQAYNNYFWDGIGSKSTSSEHYGNEAHTNYANDYYNSSIRKWLNDDFYNTAFSESQQKKLLKYDCDNSCYSSSYPEYDSQNSSDKVFLLSDDEVKNTEYGFNSDQYEDDPARRAKGTDYAKCQGLGVSKNSESEYDGNSFWWLRSPGNISFSACGVCRDGSCGISDGVCITDSGVRPALKLNLTSINELAVIDFDGKENNDTNAIEKAKKQTESAAENSKKTIIIISAISALILLAAAAILIKIFKTDKAKAIPQEEVYTEPQEKYSSTTRIEFDETPKTKEPAGPTVRQAESEIKLSCVKCEAGGICSMCKSETEQLYSITASKNGRSQTVTVCRSCAEEIVSKYKK